MISRIAKTVVSLAAVVTAITAVACIDTSAPKGPAAISPIQVPELFVVRGDVMRDTLGNPAKPGLIAYDAAGAGVPDPSATFFITDSIRFAHLDANGMLFGDSIGAAHMLGQIGGIQTLPATIYVTTVPKTLVNTTPTADSIKMAAGTDSATAIASLVLSTAVRGTGDSAIGGAIVRYNIEVSLPARGSSPPVFLVDDAGNPSVVDTTDGSGLATRKLVVNTLQVNDPALIAGTKTGTVVVVARMKYKGAELAGSPLRMVIRIKGPFTQ